MRFGFHISITGRLTDVVERAVLLGCDTLQIFTRNPRGWANPKQYSEKEIDEFKSALKERNIQPLIVHLPYLPNLASPDPILLEKSINTLISDLNWAERLSAPYVVVHPGKHKEAGAKEGIKRVIDSINTCLAFVKNDVLLLLENTAGQGTEIGAKIEEIAEMIDGCKEKERIGICLDICHLYVAGYDVVKDLDGVLSLVDREIGLFRVKLLHGNDCKAECGSHIDRHNHIGEGTIGDEGFRNIVNHPRLCNLPLILETPRKEDGDDTKNMAKIRSFIN
jgi:deoxyribonuclease-4